MSAAHASRARSARALLAPVAAAFGLALSTLACTYDVGAFAQADDAEPDATPADPPPIDARAPDAPDGGTATADPGDGHGSGKGHRKADD